MNKKVKLKGRLNMYMRWPVLLSALLLVATVLMYLVDYRAGLLMTACFVLYVAAAIVIYFYLKPSIVDELVNFAIEFAQVQHNLIHDLDYYQSGDTCRETYIESKNEFKKKWFGNRKIRIEKIVDKKIDQLREEVKEMIGYQE